MGMSKSDTDAVLRIVGDTFGTSNQDYKDEFGLVIFERMLNNNPDSRKVFLSYGIPQDASSPITIPMLKENKKMQVRIPRQLGAMREMFALIEDHEVFYKTGIKMGKIHARLGLEVGHLRTLEAVVLEVLCEKYDLEFGSATYVALQQILSTMTNSMNEGMMAIRQRRN